MSNEDDGLKAWFEANYPKDEQPDVTLDYPEVEDEGDHDELDSLRSENDRLKQELDKSHEIARYLTDAIAGLNEALRHYQDASPLLYKLLTDLELDEYRATDYELMILPGTITTERNELAMEWVLRRVYEGGPNDHGYDVDLTDPF